MFDCFCEKKGISARYSLLLMLDADVYLLLYLIYLRLRSHMSRKSQCRIYPRLTGKLVKLMSKVRYVSEKALAMVKRLYLASIWQHYHRPRFGSCMSHA